MANSYTARRRRNAARERESAEEAKDIGPLPKVANWARRKRCERDLLKYMLTYLRESFPLDFSKDHLDFVAAVQRCILDGGAKAQAMPRGSGKTTIILAAITWAQAYGHRRFVVLIAAETEASAELADDVRIVWETNEKLAEDFPEVAYPVQRLQGVVQRAKTQTLDGRQTFMRWSGRKLVMPTILVDPNDPRADHSVPATADGRHPTKTSGCVLRATGILARVRGMKHTDTAGRTIRPDVVLVEDFQTDESADSELQCAKRERKIAAGILGLAGPGKSMAAFATCTVIRFGDAADRLLNRVIYPRWRGTRCKLVNRWPNDIEADGPLWKRYLEIRDEELEQLVDDLADCDNPHPKATAYYRKNRRKMDAGADIPWRDRKFAHELSHVEHAVNLRHDNPDSFDSEYQNEPKDEVARASAFTCLTSDEFCTKAQSTLPRGEVPDWAQTLVTGWDVQGSVLLWVVVAVGEGFRGHVVDYGSWPKQRAAYFSRSEVPKTLQQATGLHGTAAITAALDSLADELCGREYRSTSGSVWRIERGNCDSGFETKTVYSWSDETASPILACMGFGIGAKNKPYEEYRRKKGERYGYGWRIQAITKTQVTRRVDIDTNLWKTQLHQRFALPKGSEGRWTICRERMPARHRMFADHMTAEFPTLVKVGSREVYEWAARPGRENDFLDATVYAAVAANMAGVRHPDQQDERKRRRRAVAPKNAAEARRSRRQAKRERTDDPSCKVPEPSARAKRTGKSMAEMRAAKRRDR